jgi:hypothetical protein
MEKILEKPENKVETHEYYFEGIKWVPGYGDFDQDDDTVIATSKEEAWKKLRGTWKGVALVSIDGIKLEKAERG